MSGDYINRKAVLEEAEKVSLRERNYRTYGNVVRSIPAADVEEVQYCRFSLEEARRRESVYKCSACGNYLTVRADTLNGGRADMNYCPFCGRKVMHKGQEGGQDDAQ